MKRSRTPAVHLEPEQKRKASVLALYRSTTVQSWLGKLVELEWNRALLKRPELAVFLDAPDAVEMEAQ